MHLTFASQYFEARILCTKRDFKSRRGQESTPQPLALEALALPTEPGGIDGNVIQIWTSNYTPHGAITSMVKGLR